MAVHERDEMHAHFEQVLQLEGVARTAYLETLREKAPHIEIRVRALLADLGEAEAAGFLDTDAVAEPPRADPVQVGPYRILKVLGRGGMGTVYLAEQGAPVRRKVALKLVHASAHARGLWRCFETEQRLLAFLDHRHITRLYDFGTTGEGTPYFAMEYVAGSPITEFCDRHRLNLRQRLSLFSGLCEAVHHAHQKGIIHRDIKPGNVLVKWEEGVPVPKIIDFGIARATVTHEEGELSGETVTVIGTPSYMSPEQLLGLPDIDTRSDIYSLGVLLYELLVGCTPLANRHKALPLEQRLRRIREGRIPPASKRLHPGNTEDEAIAESRGGSATALKHRLRGDLDRICLKALARDRSQRYGTASELADDIHRYLSHRPVSATAPGAWYRLNRFVRRHRLGVASACVVSIALFAGVTATAMALFRTRAAETQALRAAMEARTSANRAEAAFSVLQNILASPDPYGAGRDIRVSELLARFPEELPKNLVDEETEALLRHTIGRTYSNMGRYETALDELSTALELRTCRFGANYPETLETALLTTQVLSELGRFEEAAERSRDLLRRTEEYYGENHPLRLEAVVNMMGIQLERRQFAQVLELGDTGLVHALDLYGEAHPTTILLYNYLGQVFLYRRELSRADQYLGKAFDLSQKVHGDKHPQTLDTMHNYLSLGLDMDRAAETAPLAEKLYGYQREVRGEEHPFTLGALSLWGHALLGTGAYERAETVFYDLLVLGLQVFGPDHHRLAYCLHYLGRAAYAAGHYEDAADFIRQALPIEARHFGLEGHRVAITHFNLGLALTEIPDQRRVARNHLETAALLFRNLDHGAGLHPTLMALARLCRLEGRSGEAVRYSEEAAEWTQCLPPSPPPSNMIVEGIP